MSSGGVGGDFQNDFSYSCLHFLVVLVVIFKMTFIFLSTFLVLVVVIFKMTFIFLSEPRWW